MLDEDEKAVFEFKYTDAGGGTNALKFSADTWTEALERFIQFLRGSGFFLEYDSIAVNAEKHKYFYSDLIGSFYPEHTKNAGHGFPEIDASPLPCYGNDCNKYGGNE